MKDIANAIVRAVAELPDRNSPEGQPETMLVTADELCMIVTEAIAAAPQFVEIREPTQEECAAIHKEWMRAHGIEGYGAVCNGRAMFNAVRAVMWPKEGL